MHNVLSETISPILSLYFILKYSIKLNLQPKLYLIYAISVAEWFLFSLYFL